MESHPYFGIQNTAPFPPWRAGKKSRPRPNAGVLETVSFEDLGIDSSDNG
jgi:hypothetical protein